MTYTFYELLWLFFAYSFAGWILETVAAAVKKRTFVNRGLVNGPLCVTYGAAAAAMTTLSVGVKTASTWPTMLDAAVMISSLVLPVFSR